MTTRVLLAVLLALSTALSVLPASATHGPLHGRVAALDPGHNERATDTGAINTINGTTLEERDVNWTVVAATKSKLEALGASVVRTRGQDEYVDRPTRYQRAAAGGAEVLVSVHHNGSADPTVNDTITYYTQRSDQRIASLAQGCLVTELGFPDNGIRRDGFGMTVKPKMPSALTEAWFVTNDTLATRYLANPGSLIEPEAAALTNVISRYLTTTSSRCL